MIHECDRKIGPIWEVATGLGGRLHCMSCSAELDESQIHKSVITKIKKRRK
jgi:hypothetical protein